ncbi:hypothetical protein PVAP13_3NG103502 [Panicum virgatum]|uniref:Uncharacterized protein n=1 Tax=Panicum virgatum TaxID=38727 RepID=A0A8T0UGZ6_PANVG|nr:hypothetical protein PVAP13_3NG103502 [Panicum virgatum]
MQVIYKKFAFCVLKSKAGLIQSMERENRCLRGPCFLGATHPRLEKASPPQLLTAAASWSHPNPNPSRRRTKTLLLLVSTVDDAPPRRTTVPSPYAAAPRPLRRQHATTTRQAPCLRAGRHGPRRSAHGASTSADRDVALARRVASPRHEALVLWFSRCFCFFALKTSPYTRVTTLAPVLESGSGGIWLLLCCACDLLNVGYWLLLSCCPMWHIVSLFRTCGA